MVLSVREYSNQILSRPTFTVIKTGHDRQTTGYSIINGLTGHPCILGSVIFGSALFAISCKLTEIGNLAPT